jgi:hypothetical protein
MGGKMKSAKNMDDQKSSMDFMALSHPLILFSIAVLLVNDHILKIYFPSWLTGKLSDFAGLFFFPILLSTILNMIFKPIKIRQQYIALIAFSATALWFTLIKTFPFFSNLTESFLSSLLSHPWKIVCDPTDLIALIMLLPAWRLRMSVLGKKKNTKMSYVAFCFASIATLASSPGAPLELSNLIVYDNRVFADFDFYGEIMFYSSDGKTWTKMDFNRPAETDIKLPAQIIDQISKSPELPVSLCLPGNPNICYQTAPEAVLQSSDGGKTWATSWSIPLGRREFMNRISSYYPSVGPNDLVLITPNNNNILVAAMGTEGVLVKTNDGPWEAVGVNGLGPISYETMSLSIAIDVVSTELIVIIFMSLLLYVLINIKKPKKKGSFC